MRNRAHFVIQDTIPAAIHPGTGLYTESRSQWAKWDKETGYITSGTVQRARKENIEEKKGVLKLDRLQAMRKAKAVLENGMHPRSPAYKESLRREGQDKHLSTSERREKREKISAEYIKQITMEMINDHGITGK